MLGGVDISHHQLPENIDWKEVAKTQYFAICRATYGTRIDSHFESHIQGAYEAGLVVGAYHFFRFEGKNNPVEEADTYLRALEISNMIGCAMLPPILDLEANDRWDEPVDTQEERLQYMQEAGTWLSRIAIHTGVKPIIYTNRSFVRNLSQFWNRSTKKMQAYTNWHNYPLWVAHWTQRDKPRLPTIWDDWLFWQWTENGTVRGINGYVDRNWYKGDLPSLLALATKLKIRGVA